MSAAPRCHKRTCRTLLVERIDAIGRVRFVCPTCARNDARRAARLCRDCPASLGEGASPRCADCRRRQRRRLGAKNSRVYTRRMKAMTTDERAQRRPRVRRAKESRESWRAYQRAWVKEVRRDPDYREMLNARKRKEKAAKMAQRTADAARKVA